MKGEKINDREFWTVSQLANVLGKSSQTIQYRCFALGIKPKDFGHYTKYMITQEEAEQIRTFTQKSADTVPKVIYIERHTTVEIYPSKLNFI